MFTLDGMIATPWPIWASATSVAGAPLSNRMCGRIAAFAVEQHDAEFFFEQADLV